jgi:transposase-like protein
MDPQSATVVELRLYGYSVREIAALLELSIRRVQREIEKSRPSIEKLLLQ